MALQSLHTATTGLRALSTEIDVIANNLANVNTTGFKRSRVNFEDLLYQERQLAGDLNSAGQARPAGTYVGLGVRVSSTQLIFTQGNTIETGAPTDMAINGDGFFKVSINEDIGGGVGYTRAGNFVVNADGDFVLANSNGYRLEPPVTIPTNATNINITSDGRVMALLPGEIEPAEVGQIELARFPNPSGLTALGGNIYIETAASGEPLEDIPGNQGLGEIISGFLENSNVDAVRELVNLIETQRAFELNSQVITTSDEILRTITHLNA